MSNSIEELYKIFKTSQGVTTDTRSIAPGSIFFAMRGETFNGNLFAKEAISKGALLAVIDDPSCECGQSLLVDNVLETLQELARYHRDNLNIPVIGITGTNGKTTTKELVKRVIGSKYNVLATEGNLNNHIGVPLTLLKINDSTEIAIIEMGANHPGEIGFLCSIADPTHGLITNIGKAHLAGFGGFEGVIKTKNELYQYLKYKERIVFVNSDNPLLMELSEGMNRIEYGSAPDSETRVTVAASDPFLVVNWADGTEIISITTQLIGSYNLENVAAAITVGKSFNVLPEEITQSITSYIPSNNRSQSVQTKHNLVIMDAYNANPSSMKAALLNFSKMQNPNKFVMLGDMLELGIESESEHLAIIHELEESGLLRCILIGPEFSKAAGDKMKTFPDVTIACDWLRNHPIKGCTILVKGSRGIRMEKLMDLL